MGLDMYAYVSREKPASETPDCLPEDAIRIHCWRKHPDLHGWMEHLYRVKGGTDEHFNCSLVVLDGDDLKHLEKIIKAQNLPHTEGFFFGTSADHDMNEDLEFIDKARRALQMGLTVFYNSWW